MNAYLQDLIIKQKRGEMSMNKAYKEWSNAGGQGSFKDFMSQAVNKGWFDQAFNGASALLHSKYNPDGSLGGQAIADTPCSEGYEKDENGICQPIKKGMSTVAIVGIGLALVTVVAGVIYLSRKKK